LPDLGNPQILARLCWWQEYAGLLADVGLLPTIRKARSTESMAFGDGVAATPLFMLVQVPLWYSCAGGSSLLVFVNIRIVPNMVGLLDGKANMVALGFSCSFANNDALFHCRGQRLEHIDEDSHFFLKLDKPHSFRQNEKGLAVYPTIGGTLAAHEVHAWTHCRSDTNTTRGYGGTFRDRFPDITDSRNGARQDTSSSQRRLYASAIWANQVLSASELPASEGQSSPPGTPESPPLDDLALGATRSEESDGLIDHEERLSSDIGPETQNIVSLEDVDRLHRKLGHPSASQLVRLLRNSEDLSPQELQKFARAIRELRCSFCQRRARRRTPGRPQVAVPSASAS
jgi:hypothetical protein